MTQQQAVAIVAYFYANGINAWRIQNNLCYRNGYLIEWASVDGNTCWIDNQGSEPAIFRVYNFEECLEVLDLLGISIEKCRKM